MSPEESVEHLRWQIGDATVTRVEESIVWLDPDSLLIDVDTAMVDRHPWLRPAFFSDRNDKMSLSVHSFIVESEGTIVVVDTCVGESEAPLPNNPDFPALLDAAVPGGLEAVDIVLCTHLHFDHVGWNLRTVDGATRPTFPNARYLFSRREFEGTEDHEREGVQLLFDLGVATLVDDDLEITSEVRLVPTPGHTPGHVSVEIASGPARAVITGDMAHSPIQLVEPHIASSFDDDAEAAIATRHTMIPQWRDSRTLLLGTHFAPPTAGRLLDGQMVFTD